MAIISNIIPQLQIIQEPLLRSIVVFILVYFVTKIALQISLKFFTHLSQKTKTDLDDLIVEKFTIPLSIISFLVSVSLALRELGLDQTSSIAIDNTVYTILAVTIGYAIYTLVELIITRAWAIIAQKKDILDNTLLTLAQNIITVLFYVVMSLYILSIWGVQIAPLLTGLGIAGLAVALALQPTLGNVFSGVALILGKTFRIGDVIKIQSGEMGVVYHIGLRTTQIKTFDNEVFIIPNSKLADSVIQNFFLPDKSVRVNVEFGVEYGVDPEYVKQLAIEEINQIDFIDKEKEIRVLFTQMGDSSLNFKAMYWVKDISLRWPANQEGMTRIYRRLYKENIGIPFPQRTVWLRDEGKAKAPSPLNKKYKHMQKEYLSHFGHKMPSQEQSISSEKKKIVRKKK